MFFSLDSLQGTPIFEVVARDGDAGSPRSLSLRLEGDRASLFELRFEPGAAVEADGTHRAQIVVSGNGVIDREQEVIFNSPI